MSKSESCKTVKPKKVDKFRRHPISAAFLEAVKFYFSLLSLALSLKHTRTCTHIHRHTRTCSHTRTLSRKFVDCLLSHHHVVFFFLISAKFSHKFFFFLSLFPFQSLLSYLFYYFFISIYLYDFFLFISHSSNPSSCLNNHFHDLNRQEHLSLKMQNVECVSMYVCLFKFNVENSDLECI